METFGSCQRASSRNWAEPGKALRILAERRRFIGFPPAWGDEGLALDVVSPLM
jgi:hypothetical protein